MTLPVRAIAFYLSQYHPIPENDLWWGKGFTDWRNVTRARPNFVGHYQPQLPADFGFYDLRVPETLERQAALARSYGLHGFCYYYYWFAGKRLLEKPIEVMRQSRKPDFPYCFCWANENWTRRWDGKDNEVLIAQNPSPTDAEVLIRDVLPHFRDPRYIRVDGKPVFIVYRVGMLPDPRATAETWREVCRREGVGDLYLCVARTYDTGDPSQYGFDALVEFPPHGIKTLPVNQQIEFTNPAFNGFVYDYRHVVEDLLLRRDVPYVRHLTLMPGWDNTARRPDQANTFINASPEIYEVWLREVVARTTACRRPEERLVFINAWNEWAEGAHLEPDQRYGHQYLQATLRALSEVPVAGSSRVRFGGGRDGVAAPTSGATQPG
jgi:lipopolysaccharide biosynthesis protein